MASATIAADSICRALALYSAPRTRRLVLASSAAPGRRCYRYSTEEEEEEHGAFAQRTQGHPAGMRWSTALHLGTSGSREEPAAHTLMCSFIVLGGTDCHATYGS